MSEEFTDELFATANRFPHGHNLTSWEAMLDRTTPSAFADDGTTEDAPASWCTDLAQVVISEAELSQQPLTPSTATVRGAPSHNAVMSTSIIYCLQRR